MHLTPSYHVHFFAVSLNWYLFIKKFKTQKYFDGRIKKFGVRNWLLIGISNKFAEEISRSVFAHHRKPCLEEVIESNAKTTWLCKWLCFHFFLSFLFLSLIFKEFRQCCKSFHDTELPKKVCCTIPNYWPITVNSVCPKCWVCLETVVSVVGSSVASSTVFNTPHSARQPVGRVCSPRWI